VNRSPPVANAFARLSPYVRSELRRRSLAGMQSPARSLREVFLELYGEDHHPQELMHFLIFAAPLARRVALELASSGDLIGSSDISVAELERCLWWLETFDPLSARLVDLHYFAGLTPKQLASIFGMSPRLVLQDLRFARAWLRARL
jgi:DNA-directed RNA polymerase specialized sigma24 family protein